MEAAGRKWFVHTDGVFGIFAQTRDMKLRRNCGMIVAQLMIVEPKGGDEHDEVLIYMQLRRRDVRGC